MDTKYPDVKVNFDRIDGNAFAILGCVKQALRNNGVKHAEIEQFITEATSGDYDHLLATCIKWVEVE